MNKILLISVFLFNRKRYNIGVNFEIWVDADSIPKALRPIILRACVRTGAKAVFAADRSLADVVQFIADDTAQKRAASGLEGEDRRKIKSKISMCVVKTGENSADDFIVENASKEALCITHDIPLASRLLEKGCVVIDDRGRDYSKDNIRQLLSDRAVNNELRNWGVFAEQQKKMTGADTKAFADNLDRKIRSFTGGRQ